MYTPQGFTVTAPDGRPYTFTVQICGNMYDDDEVYFDSRSEDVINWADLNPSWVKQMQNYTPYLFSSLVFQGKQYTNEENSLFHYHVPYQEQLDVFDVEDGQTVYHQDDVKNKIFTYLYGVIAPAVTEIRGSDGFQFSFHANADYESSALSKYARQKVALFNDSNEVLVQTSTSPKFYSFGLLNENDYTRKIYLADVKWLKNFGGFHGCRYVPLICHISQIYHKTRNVCVIGGASTPAQIEGMFDTQLVMQGDTLHVRLYDPNHDGYNPIAGTINYADGVIWRQVSPVSLPAQEGYCYYLEIKYLVHDSGEQTAGYYVTFKSAAQSFPETNLQDQDARLLIVPIVRYSEGNLIRERQPGPVNIGGLWI